jgi:hypothetical protein
MLATVRDFLTRLGPTLDRGAKFEARVAVYLLDIAGRQLVAPSRADADTTRLCADIRSGARDASWDATLEAELDAVVSRVKIVRPDHLESIEP